MVCGEAYRYDVQLDEESFGAVKNKSGATPSGHLVQSVLNTLGDTTLSNNELWEIINSKGGNKDCRVDSKVNRWLPIAPLQETLTP